MLFISALLISLKDEQTGHIYLKRTEQYWTTVCVCFIV